jgi:ankyrin repeat protein
MVELLLNSGANLECWEGIYPRINNNEALYIASSEGHVEIVQLLLERGINIDTELAFGSGKNALHIASYRGHHEVVKLLLDRGANVNMNDYYGENALHYATDQNMWSCGYYFEIVMMLLDKGIDINMVDNEGYIPLHYAAKSGHTGIVKLLLDAGSKIHEQTYDDGLWKL